MDHDDERYVPRPELEKWFEALKSEVKAALTRQQLLLLGGIAFLKSDLHLPPSVTVGAITLLAVKFTAGFISR